jgi:hydrogenase-1 operon protein HyaE
LRAGIVATRAEAALKQRFHVGVFPSLVVTRGRETLGVLPKVCDWSDYIARIEAMLSPGAPALVAASGPRVEVIYSKREAAR